MDTWTTPKAVRWDSEPSREFTERTYGNVRRVLGHKRVPGYDQLERVAGSSPVFFFSVEAAFSPLLGDSRVPESD